MAISLSIAGFTAIVLVTIALAALVVLRPSLVVARGGRVLAFLALFFLPLLVTGLDKLFTLADDVPTALATIQMK